MTFPEIVCFILLAVVGLQIWFIRYLIKTTLETMRGSHEVSQMAMELSQRVLRNAGCEPPPLPSTQSLRQEG